MRDSSFLKHNSEKPFGVERYIISPQISFGRGPWMEDDTIKNIPDFLEKWNTGIRFKTIKRDGKILTLITCSYLNIYDSCDQKMNTMRIVNLLTRVEKINIKINIMLPNLVPVASLDFTDCVVEDFPFDTAWDNNYNNNWLPTHIDVVFTGVQI